MFLATSAKRMATASRVRATFPTTTRITSIRGLHNTRVVAFPSKNAQGKDDLEPMGDEYSKSGSDQQSAAMEQAAFDPSQTSPEQQMETADKESGEVGQSQSDDNNPLEMSPANIEASQPNDPKGGPAESSSSESKDSESGRQRTSGGGSAPKAGGGKSGGGTSGTM